VPTAADPAAGGRPGGGRLTRWSAAGPVVPAGEAQDRTGHWIWSSGPRIGHRAYSAATSLIAPLANSRSESGTTGFDPAEGNRPTVRREAETGNRLVHGRSGGAPGV